MSTPFYSPAIGGMSMPFNAIIAEKSLSLTMSAMVIRNLKNHLMVWGASIPEAAFQVHQIGDLIYFSTNSVEMLSKYVQYEAPYVAYMLESEESVDEWEMWDPKQVA